MVALEPQKTFMFEPQSNQFCWLFQPAHKDLFIYYSHWDKKYNFILVTKKDTVPIHAAIDDDNIFGRDGDDNEEYDNNEFNNDTNNSSS